MNHRASADFREFFEKLPAEIKGLARKNFDLLKRDSRHPSLRLKKVGPYWSVRVGLHYRALGKPIEDGILWGWIGSHDEYDGPGVIASSRVIGHCSGPGGLRRYWVPSSALHGGPPGR